MSESQTIHVGQIRQAADGAARIVIRTDLGNGQYYVRLDDWRLKKWIRATVLKRFFVVVAKP